MLSIRFFILFLLSATMLSATQKQVAVQPAQQKNSISFTQEEIAYINKQIPIRYVFDPNWEPFEYKDRIQQHKGIVADILKLVKTKTNLNLVSVPTEAWKEAVELVKSGKADMFSAINETPERKKYLNYTKNTLFSYKAILLKHKSDTYDYTKGSIKQCCVDRTIGVIKGYVLEEYFKKVSHNFKVVVLDSTTEGFEALANKEIDLFAINDVTANYFIFHKGFGNVAFARQLNYIYSLKIAMRKEVPPIVLNILDKALSTISKSELSAIYEKWVSTTESDVQQKEYKSIKVQDIVPFKEIGLIVAILVVVGLLLMRFLKKRRDIPLTVPVFVLVGIFLVSIIFITLVSVKNLEQLKKEEFGYSLSALLNSTHESIKKLLNTQQKLLSIILDDEAQDFENFPKKYQNLREKVNFLTSYTIVDTNYTVIASSDKSLVGRAILNEHVMEAITQAAKFGWYFLVPYQDVPKQFQNLMYCHAIVDKKTIQLKGVVVLGINQNLFQSVLEKGRLGKTGEIYVVNNDKTFISNSRFKEQLYKEGIIDKEQKAFLNVQVNTVAVKSALRKENGINTDGYIDYRNAPVYGAWEWNNELGVAIISEIDKEEAMHSFEELKATIYYAIFGIAGFVVLLMIFIVWLANRRRRELLRFNSSLEKKVQLRTRELEEEKQFVQTVLNSQEQMIVTSDGRHLVSVNEAFYNFFGVDSVHHFEAKFDTHCICDLFGEQEGFLQKNMGELSWINHIIAHSNDFHKVVLHKDGKEYIFSVTAATIQDANNLNLAVFTDITLLEKAKKEVEAINRRTKESIEYASLIQGALIPEERLFFNYFQDLFTYWEPKDTVGGDIFLFEELKKGEDCLLMMIDCTGHGVPGAFVTMLVKAIERQVVLKLKHEDIEVDPAKILSFFNKTMKHLLNQENKDNISNAGFDGGILYYNKKEKIVKYAGAETPLFYLKDDKLKMIKGDRYSVGYKKCDTGYVYTSHTIEVKDGMKFYLTTDGYLDQNGGKKGFPFGKKRLKEIITEYYETEMAIQKEIFISKLLEYQKTNERNDDITLIALEI